MIDRSRIRRALSGLSVTVLMFVFAAVAAVAAPYSEWRYSGAMHILTTPDGADLPVTAAEDNFPLLVRLTAGSFDFSQAKSNGDDVRFAGSDGAPLAYEIERWDATAGEAAIWVRIPHVAGNAVQRINMHWGKADAESESNGAAVFNAGNGYVSVWHLGDDIVDAAGTLEAKDTGTAPAPGMIGRGRHFPGGKGITGGENITALPGEGTPHTTEAWVRAEGANGTVVAWGNEKAQGKVVMQFASPPHIRMDCYFSAGNVAGESRLPTAEWLHVVYTYQEREARVYVNGVLDGVATGKGPALAIKSPARMYIGGWYNNYSFIGDLDEVRISNVARSADWVKLQVANQKPMQSLVGHLVQSGKNFSVSTDALTIDEGRAATVTGEAGGALKVYWILQADGGERVVAVDRFSVNIEAGRTTGDKSQVLQFKAIYADGVKTKEIPVTIKEAIPEPIFTLKAPTAWDGRQTIEVVPQISNLAAMKAAAPGELTYNWSVSGLATIHDTAADRLVLKRAQNSGELKVTLSLSNGGKATSATATVTVQEPGKDTWVQRLPDTDEKPLDNQFYARDDKNEGTLYCNGTLEQAADEVALKVFADDKLTETLTQKPAGGKSYAFTAKLKPGLIKYRVELIAKTGGAETTVYQAGNLVCGDAYIIDGQSNGLATDTREESPRDTNEWVRSYADPRRMGKATGTELWCNPVWKAQKDDKAELGWWGMELAKNLVASQKMPIFMINGAVGGTRIDQHQREVANPENMETIYGRLLWRVRQAKMTHGIRAILWHQGENDQGAAGPSGGYGWEAYQDYFVAMSAAWKQDFPNVQHYYVFQIWPNSCSMGGGNGNMLRERQRSLPELFSNMDAIATLGVQPPGGCHFPLEGWSKFADMVQPLIERDFYGRAVTAPITSPNLRKARFTTAAKDEIALEFDQPVEWNDGLINEFYLSGAKGQVASGSGAGTILTLKLKEPTAAQQITYLDERSWSQDRLLIGKNGLAALTFCDVSIRDARDAR